MSSKHTDHKEVSTSEANHAAAGGFVLDGRVLNVAEIASRYRPFLKTIAESEFPAHLRARCDDSDVIQETLLRATQHADQFRGSTQNELESWLREMLLNQIKDFMRFHGRQQRDAGIEKAVSISEVADSDPTVSEELRRIESRELIWKAVDELPQDYRTVMLLRHQVNLSFAEIAEQMDRSPDAVRMLWGRAVMVLGQKLKPLT